MGLAGTARPRAGEQCRDATGTRGTPHGPGAPQRIPGPTRQCRVVRERHLAGCRCNRRRRRRSRSSWNAAPRSEREASRRRPAESEGYPAQRADPCIQTRSSELFPRGERDPAKLFQVTSGSRTSCSEFQVKIGSVSLQGAARYSAATLQACKPALATVGRIGRPIKSAMPSLAATTHEVYNIGDF
jgi:hypothetical protein